MTQQYWIIKGYEGTAEIFDAKVKVHLFTERQIGVLLRTLTAKYLDHDEILGALARRKSPMANDLLEVQKEGPFPMFRCGVDTHFIAKVEPFDYDRNRLPY